MIFNTKILPLTLDCIKNLLLMSFCLASRTSSCEVAHLKTKTNKKLKTLVLSWRLCKWELSNNFHSDLYLLFHGSFFDLDLILSSHGNQRGQSASCILLVSSYSIKVKTDTSTLAELARASTFWPSGLTTSVSGWGFRPQWEVSLHL